MLEIGVAIGVVHDLTAHRACELIRRRVLQGASMDGFYSQNAVSEFEIMNKTSIADLVRHTCEIVGRRRCTEPGKKASCRRATKPSDENLSIPILCG